MFGFALFFIGSCLYNFPAAEINNRKLTITYTIMAAKPYTTGADRLADPYSLRAIVEQYTILFSLCGFIVVIFASVCLAIRMKALSDSSSSIFLAKSGLVFDSFPSGAYAEFSTCLHFLGGSSL